MGSPLERTVRSRRVAGVAGDIADVGIDANVDSYINDDPRAAQVDTLTVDTATDDTVYTVVIDGVTVTYTSGTGASTSSVAEGLRDAINAEQQINGVVVATASSANVLLTARVAGEGFVTSESDSRLSLANTTANDEADPIGFGRAVLLDGYGTSAGESNTAKALSSAALSGPGLVLAPDVANETEYGVVLIDPEGLEYVASYTSDGTATTKEIVDGLDAALTALSITGLTNSEDDSELTVEAPIGWEITPLDAELFTTVTYTDGADVDELIVGVTVRDKSQEVDIDSDEAQYGPNEPMSVLTKGSIYVDIESSLVAGSKRVWVRYAADGALDKIGSFAPAAGTGLALWSKAKFERQAGSGLAILKVNV